MRWPRRTKCKSPIDQDRLYYEITLGINHNALIKRFWCESRLRKKHRIWPDAIKLAKHHLEITITYMLGEQAVSETYKKTVDGTKFVWSKTPSALTGPTGSLPIQLVGIEVQGGAWRDGKTYALTCRKLN